MEKIKLYPDAAGNWYLEERYAKFAEINFGSSNITSSGGGAIKGSTVVLDNFWGARDGNYMHFRYEFKNVSAAGGAAGTGDYNVSLPSPTGSSGPIQFDLSRVTTNSGVFGAANTVPNYTLLGTGGSLLAAVSGMQLAYAANANQFKIHIPGNGTWSAGYGSIIAANNNVCVSGKFPVQEWNS